VTVFLPNSPKERDQRIPGEFQRQLTEFVIRETAGPQSCCGCRFFGQLAEWINLSARKTPSTRPAAEQVNFNAWFRDFLRHPRKKRTPIPLAHLASGRASPAAPATLGLSHFLKLSQKTAPGGM